MGRFPHVAHWSGAGSGCSPINAQLFRRLTKAVKPDTALVHCEIGVTRSRPFLYALPSGSKFTHLTAWTLPSKGLMTETHVQKTAASFEWLTSKDFRKGL
jgi:hypothetical protein